MSPRSYWLLNCATGHSSVSFFVTHTTTELTCPGIPFSVPSFCTTATQKSFGSWALQSHWFKWCTFQATLNFRESFSTVSIATSISTVFMNVRVDAVNNFFWISSEFSPATSWSHRALLNILPTESALTSFWKQQKRCYRLPTVLGSRTESVPVCNRWWGTGRVLFHCGSHFCTGGQLWQG